MGPAGRCCPSGSGSGVENTDGAELCRRAPRSDRSCPVCHGPNGTGVVVGCCCWGSREVGSPPRGLCHLYGVPVPKPSVLTAWHRWPQPFHPAAPSLAPAPTAGFFLSSAHPWSPPSPPPLIHCCHHVPTSPDVTRVGSVVPLCCQHPRAPRQGGRTRGGIFRGLSPWSNHTFKLLRPCPSPTPKPF